MIPFLVPKVMRKGQHKSHVVVAPVISPAESPSDCDCTNLKPTTDMGKGGMVGFMKCRSLHWTYNMTLKNATVDGSKSLSQMGESPIIAVGFVYLKWLACDSWPCFAEKNL